MPKPFDLKIHPKYIVNKNSSNYHSFTDPNGEEWYTDRPLVTYKKNKLAYVTNNRQAKWVTIGDYTNT